MGHVILDQGPRRLAGDSLTFDLDSQDRHAPPRHRPGRPRLLLHRRPGRRRPATTPTWSGTASSPPAPSRSPDWSFRLREATVQVDGYAHVHDATMRAKKLPVLYTPYLLWPVKSDRSSGFLVPNIGYSERRGAELGLAYFQTLGRSYDTTFHLDTYTKGFLGLGDEFRYAPTRGHQGATSSATAIYDPEADGSGAGRSSCNHTTNDLPCGMRGRRPVPGVLGLQLLPGLRARLRPQHPAVHRQPRLRDRQLGAAPRQLAARQTARRSSTSRPTTRSSSAGSPSSSTACARPRSARRRSTCEFASSASYLDVDRPGAYRGSTAASTSSRRSPCR